MNKFVQTFCRGNVEVASEDPYSGFLIFQFMGKVLRHTIIEFAFFVYECVKNNFWRQYMLMFSVFLSFLVVNVIIIKRKENYEDFDDVKEAEIVDELDIMAEIKKKDFDEKRSRKWSSSFLRHFIADPNNISSEDSSFISPDFQTKKREIARRRRNFIRRYNERKKKYYEDIKSDEPVTYIPVSDTCTETETETETEPEPETDTEKNPEIGKQTFKHTNIKKYSCESDEISDAEPGVKIYEITDAGEINIPRVRTSYQLEYTQIPLRSNSPIPINRDSPEEEFVRYSNLKELMKNDRKKVLEILPCSDKTNKEDKNDKEQNENELALVPYDEEDANSNNNEYSQELEYSFNSSTDLTIAPWLEEAATSSDSLHSEENSLVRKRKKVKNKRK